MFTIAAGNAALYMITKISSNIDPRERVAIAVLVAVAVAVVVADGLSRSAFG